MEDFHPTTENEFNVIGTVLNDPSKVWSPLETLNGKHFHDYKLGLVWEAIRQVALDGREPDMASVSAQLEATQKLDKVGGRTALMSVIAETSPVFHGLDAAVRFIVQSSRFRRLAIIGKRIQNMPTPTEPGDVDDRISEAAGLIRELLTSSKDRGAHPLSGLADELWEETLNPDSAKNDFVLTGFKQLDRRTGGFRPHNFIVLAARPGVGKTALALAFCLNAARNGKRTVYFSLEMSTKEVYRRLVSMDSGVDLSSIVGTDPLSDGDRERFSVSLASLAKMPLYVCDDGGLTVDGLVAECQRLATVKGLDFVVVDYCQLLSSERRHESRLQEMAFITRSLKRLAKSLKVPVVGLSQFSRAAADREPQLHHLRDSGTLEQDTDIVLILTRKSANPQLAESMSIAEKRKSTLEIAKHRNGPTARFPLEFDGKTATYSEVSRPASAFPEGLQEKLQVPK